MSSTPARRAPRQPPPGPSDPRKPVPEPRAWTVEDEAWADRVRLVALLDHGLPGTAVDEALAVAAAAVEDSRQRAVDLLGPADAYARELADGEPAERRAGEEDGRSALAVGLVTGGAVGLAAAVTAAVATGWWLPVAVRHLVGVPLVALVAVLAGVVVRLRRGGRLRSSWAAGAATVAVLVAAAAVLTGGPADVVGRVPALALGLAGVALVAVGLRLPTDVRPVGEGSSPSTPEAWYRRLEGVLRGRHAVPRSRAREMAAEARGHVLASGAAHPAVELGDPRLHALALVDASGERERWRASRSARLRLAQVGLLVVLAVSAALEDGLTWFVGLTAALALLLAVSALRRRRDGDAPA
ncbi:hypothetical protein [uncultured Pseudokineococcus sp.]|uniref:hypothetical protein n=1 Tax=uncultured Pseudokineococcus sp. TaxID=1642928 RepID=UPI0026337506|nr:hypothetical protein [uncultured Pseudokineococcus sp.]